MINLVANGIFEPHIFDITLLLLLTAFPPSNQDTMFPLHFYSNLGPPNLWRKSFSFLRIPFPLRAWRSRHFNNQVRKCSLNAALHSSMRCPRLMSCSCSHHFARHVFLCDALHAHVVLSSVLLTRTWPTFKAPRPITWAQRQFNDCFKMLSLLDL